MKAFKQLCLLLLGGAFVSTLVAQVPTGTISGSVQDESGAIIPGAQVTITNKATDAVRNVKSGADGVCIHRAGEPASLLVPSAVRSPVDTTGCGDAFCGGMLAGWLESGNLLEGGLRGSVSASFVAEGFGAASALQADRGQARRRLEELTPATT